MAHSNPSLKVNNGFTAYTIGIRKTKPLELTKVLSNLKISDVFDVRNVAQQRSPIALRPPSLGALAAQSGAIYHDEAKTLGYRDNYQVFALGTEFAHYMEPMTKIARKGNILVLCSEADYRKCHRQTIASFLSRDGLRIH